MNRELMQRALEALRMVRFDGDCLQVRTMHAVKSVIGPLSAALAAPVAPAGDKPSTSEPRAWIRKGVGPKDQVWLNVYLTPPDQSAAWNWDALYTAPPTSSPAAPTTAPE